MSQDELLAAQVRMSAMHAAISLYCCHRAGGSGDSLSPEEILEQITESELLERLLALRNRLLALVLVQGPI